MAQIITTVQNLLNGVSQQADSQRFPSQAEEQLNGTSSPVLGLSKRNPTEHISKVFNSAANSVFAETLNRDASERYMVFVRAVTKKSITIDSSTDTINCTAHGFVADDEVRFYGTDLGNITESPRYYVISPSTDSFQISTTKGGSAFTITGNGTGTQNVSLDPISVVDLITETETTVATPNSANYLVSTTPSSSLKSTSIADYSFIINKDTTVAMETGLSSSTDYKAYVYIKQGDYGTDYNITIDGTTYTHTTPNGGTATDRPLIDTEYIATQLQSAIGTVSGFDAVNVEGSTLEIKKTDSSDFEITVSDALGDGAMGVVKDTAAAFTDLPLYCRDGQRVKVIGDVEQNADDYYVQFTADAPSNKPFGSGTWAESIAPNIKYKLDAATFCHTLIREADGTFTFKEGSWDDRLVGDTLTATDPSFIGKKLQNIVLFRDRLGFLSEESVSMSETGEYFNFFRTTVTQLLGSDPIDVRASHNKVSKLKSAVPFSRNLLLFSDRTQFMLTGGDVLSPSSVSISQETEYEVATETDPVVSGTSVYFPFERGDFSGLMQYTVSTDTEQMLGEDISSHVPKYITGNITKISSNAVDPVIALTTDGFTEGIYVYRYLNRGRDRIQSSWSKFKFETGATVENLDFIGKTLYLAVSRTEGLFVEKLSFKEDTVDSNSTYTTRLDRRVDESQCSVSYDSGTQQSTVTLPYISYGTVELASRADGSSETSGTRFIPVSQSGNTVVVAGDISSRKFWAGDTYEFSYIFNKPLLKVPSEGGGKVNASGGRFQVRRGRVAFDNTITFSIKVTPEGRPTYTHTYDGSKKTGLSIGSEQPLEDGEFTFPVMSKGDRVTIECINSSPFPSSLLTAEYEATYHSRFRQM
jgi:hypothetical protein